MDELDPYVERWFLAAIKGNVRVASASRATERGHEAQRAVEAATDKLYAFIESEEVVGDADLFKHGLETRKRKLEVAKLDLADAESEVSLYGDLPGGDLLAAWPQLSIKRRRQLVAAFVDRPNVSKGTGPVAGRVQFVRDGAVIPAPEQVGEVLAENR